MIREIQIAHKVNFNDIQHNFIFAGDDLIFQGQSFDLTTGLGLDILFLGNFTDIAPPQSLLDKLQAFLQFAVDIGKLHWCYHLYGERQINETLTSPGDKLFEALQTPPLNKHFKANFTANNLCEFGCGLYPEIVCNLN